MIDDGSLGKSFIMMRITMKMITESPLMMMNYLNSTMKMITIDDD